MGSAGAGAAGAFHLSEWRKLVIPLDREGGFPRRLRRLCRNWGTAGGAVVCVCCVQRRAVRECSGDHGLQCANLAAGMLFRRLEPTGPGCDP